LVWAAYDDPRLSARAAKIIRPRDRMLVAQAKVEGLTLLTADATLKGYGRFVRVV